MKQSQSFREYLVKRSQEIGSDLCVGLDPKGEKMPKCIREFTDGVDKQYLYWMKKIIKHTAQYALTYKLQSACYECIPNGFRVMAELIKYAN